jgi:hypothetical protein
MLRNILINNVVFGDIGLTGGWTWFQQQGQIVVWMILAYLAGKEFFGRKYGKMVVVIVFGALLALLINNPGGLLTPVGNLVKKVLGLG